MFSLFKTQKQQPIAASVLEHLRYHPEQSWVLAIQAAYLPHGGGESFWFYLEGDFIVGHAAHTGRQGQVRVRQCRVAANVILGTLSEFDFFNMKDAASEVMDGLCYSMAVAETRSGQKHSHCVSGRYIGGGGQAPTQLFQALVAHFPARHVSASC